MLAAKNRLRRSSDLARVQRSRAVFRNPRLTLKAFFRRDDQPPRIAVVVGRNVSRRAVDRNRVARWLREAVREELPRLVAGVDLRVAATAPFATYSFQQCGADVHELFLRARVLGQPTQRTGT